MTPQQAMEHHNGLAPLAEAAAAVSTADTTAPGSGGTNAGSADFARDGEDVSGRRCWWKTARHEGDNHMGDGDDYDDDRSQRNGDVCDGYDGNSSSNGNGHQNGGTTNRSGKEGRPIIGRFRGDGRRSEYSLDGTHPGSASTSGSMRACHPPSARACAALPDGGRPSPQKLAWNPPPFSDEPSERRSGSGGWYATAGGRGSQSGSSGDGSGSASEDSSWIGSGSGMGEDEGEESGMSGSMPRANKRRKTMATAAAAAAAAMAASAAEAQAASAAVTAAAAAVTASGPSIVGEGVAGEGATVAVGAVQEAGAMAVGSGAAEVRRPSSAPS